MTRRSIDAILSSASPPPPRCRLARRRASCGRIVALPFLNLHRFHSEREPVRPIMTSKFGASFAETFVTDFLFAYGGDAKR